MLETAAELHRDRAALRLRAVATDAPCANQDDRDFTLGCHDKFNILRNMCGAWLGIHLFMGSGKSYKGETPTWHDNSDCVKLLIKRTIHL